MTDKVFDDDPAWLKAAFKDVGLKEVSGKKHNPRIVEMFLKSGHPQVTDDETAWCSAAVNAWIKEGGLKGTGALTARSWLKWGKACSKDKKIPRGAVCVFPRGNSTWQGHVALCVEDTGKVLRVLGGNQSNRVSITSYPKSRLLGARWPNTVKNSRTIAAAAGSAVSGAAAETVDTVTPTLIEAQSQLSYVADGLTIAKYLLIAVSLALVGFVAWKHIKRLRGETNE